MKLRRAYLRRGNYLLEHSIVEVREATEDEKKDLADWAKEHLYIVERTVYKCSGKHNKEILKKVFGGKYRFDGHTLSESSLSFISDKEAKKIIKIDSRKIKPLPKARVKGSLEMAFQDDVIEEGLSQAKENWGGEP